MDLGKQMLGRFVCTDHLSPCLKTSMLLSCLSHRHFELPSHIIEKHDVGFSELKS
jgi:hypothetical protein